MTRFFPWGIRLAHLLDECASHMIDAIDMRHLEDDVAPFAAALLSGLRRIQDDYRQRLRNRGLSTAGMDIQRAALLASASPELPSNSREKKLSLPALSVLLLLKTPCSGIYGKMAPKYAEHRSRRCSGRRARSCADHREWLSRWKAKATLLGEERNNTPRIHFFAGYDLHSQLKELKRELEEHPHKDQRRAVVLSHDSLLMPTLHHIPEKDINISLGYPLERSLLAVLSNESSKPQEHTDDKGVPIGKICLISCAILISACWQRPLLKALLALCVHF